MSEPEFVAIPLTRGPKHYFFGYYAVPPWDATGKYLLCLETSFHDRKPTASDRAVIGSVELETARWVPTATTDSCRW